MESAAGTVNEVLRCGHVSREFDSYDGSGKNHVLKDVDFSVRENEFLVLFGPGQCGKTTLLNILAGLDTPTSGEVIDHGKKVGNRRRNAALCTRRRHSFRGSPSWEM